MFDDIISAFDVYKVWFVLRKCRYVKIFYKAPLEGAYLHWDIIWVCFKTEHRGGLLRSRMLTRQSKQCLMLPKKNIFKDLKKELSVLKLVHFK